MPPWARRAATTGTARWPARTGSTGRTARNRRAKPAPLSRNSAHISSQPRRPPTQSTIRNDAMPQPSTSRNFSHSGARWMTEVPRHIVGEQESVAAHLLQARFSNPPPEAGVGRAERPVVGDGGGRAAVEHHRARRHHQDTVQVQREFQVVGRQDDLLAEPGQRAAQQFPVAQVQQGRRLVEHQHCRGPQPGRRPAPAAAVPRRKVRRCSGLPAAAGRSGPVRPPPGGGVPGRCGPNAGATAQRPPAPSASPAGTADR